MHTAARQAIILMLGGYSLLLIATFGLVSLVTSRELMPPRALEDLQYPAFLDLVPMTQLRQSNKSTRDSANEQGRSECCIPGTYCCFSHNINNACEGDATCCDTVPEAVCFGANAVCCEEGVDEAGIASWACCPANTFCCGKNLCCPNGMGCCNDDNINFSCCNGD
jgi:hypothetical protein